MCFTICRGRCGGGGVSVIIDAREPEEYRRLGDGTATLTTDAVICGEHKRFVIERKTPSDLFHSLYDGRLIEQLIDLAEAREQGFTPILVVQGSIWKFGRQKGKSFREIMAVQLTPALFGVPLVQVFGFEGYKELLSVLKEKAGKPAQPHFPIPKKKDVSVEEERVMMLCGVKGIGPERAKEIVAKFKTIRGLVENIERLKDILGDGKLYKHVVEVIG
jgi:ERCC4-type nuclease